MNNILFPSVRDLSVVPPVISAINYLATFERVSVFSFYINKNQFDSRVNLNSLSETPYPGTKVSRIYSKLKCWFTFYLFLLKKAKNYDFIWLGVWDYALIIPFLKMAGYKGKIIYQLNELEFDQFEYCRKVDYVFVPDENRGWIAYFLGKLKRKPLVLPNIPFVPSSLSFEGETEIDKIRAQYARKDLKIILYQGGIHYKKRCILELLSAVSQLPANIVLVIMPGNASEIIIEKLNTDIKNLRLTDKVYVINSVKAPGHLKTVQRADLGIGLYRPTSLNQIYAAPNRLYEFTKFGIPVILPRYPYFKYLSMKYPFAINTVDPESIEDIVRTINTIFTEPNYGRGCANANRFTEVEGSYARVFDACWTKISD